MIVPLYVVLIVRAFGVMSTSSYDSTIDLCSCDTVALAYRYVLLMKSTSKLPLNMIDQEIMNVYRSELEKRISADCDTHAMCLSDLPINYAGAVNIAYVNILGIEFITIQFITYNRHTGNFVGLCDLDENTQVNLNHLNCTCFS